MKLKEFSLWAYNLELPESRKFTLFNRCVCAHFERHFVAIETDDVYRVVIKLGKPEARSGTTELSGSVMKYYKAFDFHYFESLETTSKKKLLLATLHESLLELAIRFSWPLESFDNANNLVIKENYENLYTHKQVSNRSGSLLAELRCNHSTESFDLFIHISEKSGRVLYEKLLFTEEPDEYLFNERVGNIKWMSADTVLHIKKDKTVLGSFDLKCIND